VVPKATKENGDVEGEEGWWCKGKREDVFERKSDIAFFLIN